MEGANPKPTLNADFPFALSEGEQIKFSEKDVTFSIKSDDDEAIQYKNGVFMLTTQKILWYNLNEKKGVFINYPNAISHGYNKLTLICLINFENDEGEEAYAGVFGNPEDEVHEEEEEKTTDILLDKLRGSDHLNNEEDFIQIIGSYHVEFEFDSKVRSTIQDVFQIFSECSAMNPDKNDANNNNFMNLLGINPEEIITGEEEEDHDDENMDEEENGDNNHNGDGGNDMVFE